GRRSEQRKRDEGIRHWLVYSFQLSVSSFQSGFGCRLVSGAREAVRRVRRYGEDRVGNVWVAGGPASEDRVGDRAEGKGARCDGRGDGILSREDRTDRARV